MAKGFLAGSALGAVISVIGAVAVSVSVGGPRMLSDPRPEVQQSALPADPANAPAAAMPGGVADPETAEPEVAEPEVVDPATADPETAEPVTAVPDVPDAAKPLPDTQAAPLPEAQDTSRPGRRPTPEDEVDLPATGTPDLDAPDAPRAVGADTTPPAQPLVGDAPAAPGGAEPDSQTTRVEVTTDAPVMPGAQAAAPGAPDPDAEPDISTEPAQPPLPAVPAGDSALVPESEVTAPPEAESRLRPAPEQGLADGAEPPQAGRPVIGTPAGSLIDRDPAVQEDRLPTLSADPDPGAAGGPGLSPSSPLFAFAAPIEAVAGVPRVSVILIDDGTGPMGPESLEAFPFPISFAIAPGHPDPARAAAAYRKLGFEVLAIGDVPDGAQASDVEVALTGALDAVPQAVAVLEAPGGGLQGSRAVSSQATTILAASGHGLVMSPKGLNTAQQLAAKQGVPSVTLFRDFDGDGQDAGAIRRTLDQAAFRARQDGAVVMLGRLRAETVSALVLWGLQDRADSIALVPVSKVLQESVAP